MENLTIEQLEKKLGIRFVTDCHYSITETRVYMPKSNDYLRIVIDWKSNKHCTNKYVHFLYDLSSSLGHHIHFFRAPRGKKFYIGLEDLKENSNKHNNWEYIGFSNLKYSVELTYISRKHSTTMYKEERE